VGLSSNSFSVRIHPGQLRFSAAHFITFDGMCENLHGHNFHVRIDAHGDNNTDGFVVDFVELTRCAAAICDTLHDRILLPGESSDVLLERADGSIHVSSHGKRFSFPEENCAVLPIANATAEMLAHYIADSVIERLRSSTTLDNVRELEVAVEEADQQWGICQMRTGDGR
jgi:6-pyruvoyltetrahydropterin/6-carboxytetrahydropterin synthase